MADYEMVVRKIVDMIEDQEFHDERDLEMAFEVLDSILKIAKEAIGKE